MTGETVLEVRGLRKRFGGLAAVDDVSLEVQRGVLYAAGISTRSASVNKSCK